MGRRKTIVRISTKSSPISIVVFWNPYFPLKPSVEQVWEITRLFVDSCNGVRFGTSFSRLLGLGLNLGGTRSPPGRVLGLGPSSKKSDISFPFIFLI